MDKRHGAIINMDFDLMAQLLDFKGGKIHRIYTDPNIFEPTYCKIMIEHPDLPEIKPGYIASDITPSYISHHRKNGTIWKIERSKE